MTSPRWFEDTERESQSVVDQIAADQAWEEALLEARREREELSALPDDLDDDDEELED